MTTTLVTINGECFEAKFQGAEHVPADDVLYYFHITDKVSGRGLRKVSASRFGPKDWYAKDFDARVDTVLLNMIRRAFDSNELSFELPDDPLHYKEITMEASDFAKQPPKSDPDIRQYIFHKAFWLGYRFPAQPPQSGAMFPISFDDAIDLNYLGADSGDVKRNILRLGNQGLLDKILEGNARPTEKLLNAHESGGGLDPKQTQNTEDRKFARLAIEEARKSISEDDGRPHPKVGAVIVKNGRVLSLAHRGQLPGNHAEFVALEKESPDAVLAGATVYTTLEPCTSRNHPKVPCATRLVERKVARVVIGMLDPDPRITGRGQRALRNANVVTDFFPADLMTEVEELNREFTRFYENQTQTAQLSANALTDWNVREQLERFAAEKRIVAIRPLIPPQFDNPNFQTDVFFPNRVDMKKSSNGQTVTIPLSRVSEILWSSRNDPPTLMLNGRIQWLTIPMRWQFLPEPPPSSEDAHLGLPRSVGGLQDPYARDVIRQLEATHYEAHWFRKENMSAYDRDWQPFYDADGRYLVHHNGHETIILAVRIREGASSR